MLQGRKNLQREREGEKNEKEMRKRRLHLIKESIGKNFLEDPLFIDY